MLSAQAFFPNDLGILAVLFLRILISIEVFVPIAYSFFCPSLCLHLLGNNITFNVSFPLHLLRPSWQQQTVALCHCNQHTAAHLKSHAQ